MAPWLEEQRVPPPQHSEEQLRVMRCRPHEMRVHRVVLQNLQTQPPRPNEPEGPYHFGPCDRCGAVVSISWDRERNCLRQQNVRVIRYGRLDDPVGQIVEGPGEIVDESALPAGGTVVDEIEIPQPRGRKSQ
jgi:hypothetical protein